MHFSYKYPRPAVTVDAIVFALVPDTKLLLIQRKNPPFQNQWSFPGGFVAMSETLEEAVERELQEETGLLLKNLRQFKTFSAIDRDPRGRTLSVAFVAKLAGEPVPLVAGDDAENARWFPLSELPALAFDHEAILKEVVRSGMSC